MKHNIIIYKYYYQTYMKKNLNAYESNYFNLTEKQKNTQAFVF